MKTAVSNRIVKLSGVKLSNIRSVDVSLTHLRISASGGRLSKGRLSGPSGVHPAFVQRSGNGMLDGTLHATLDECTRLRTV